MNSTKLIIVVLLLLLAGVGVWLVLDKKEVPPEPEPEPESVAEVTPATTQSVIGYSTENRPIESFTFGNGETDLLLVGGIHGGYEWNSSLLAYELVDYLTNNPSVVANNLTVHIIPTLNPDGLFEATNQAGRFVVTDIPNIDIHTTGIGRFNANQVDLNRNFDCRWTSEGTWRGQTVSAGAAPFSEPEAKALKAYVEKINPVASIFWHSRANNVYGSECGNPVTTETLALMNTYAKAAGYGEVPVFDAYPVTGAAEDWLASLGIPTVSVELETRTSSEFERNRAGLEAVLGLYGK